MNTNGSSEGQVREIDLTVVARLLLGNLHWLLIAGAAAAVLVYFGISFLVTPTYQSRASFYVYNKQNVEDNDGTINSSDLQAAENLATTYAKILTSNSVLDAVLEDLNQDGLTRNQLSGMESVSVVSNTQLLEVVITSSDKELACKIAESFVRVAPTEIVRVTKAGGVEVVDKPEVADSQSTPRTLHDTAIGFFVGVLLAAAFVVIREMSDTTIYLQNDVENLGEVVILGQIPHIEPDKTLNGTWRLVKGGEIRIEEKK